MNINIVNAIRQNHALEHATIALLLKRLGGQPRLMGRATTNGFYIYGDVPTEMVADAAKEGLGRLQKGDMELAISPFCGTNLAVAGVMAGVASVLAIGNKNRWERLPQAVLAALFAIMAAQPVGRLVQKHLTTSAEVSHLSIKGIVRQRSGRWTMHKVETARGQ